MIVRTYFRSSTCQHPHVVRIDVGHDEYQSHKFPCRGCSEEMVVALRLDQERGGAMPEAVENAEEINRDDAASVVNVHANFVIPEDQRHVDGTFPHMKMMHDMAMEAEKRGSFVSYADIPDHRLGARPFRRPDYSAEWKGLRGRRGRSRWAGTSPTDSSLSLI